MPRGSRFSIRWYRGGSFFPTRGTGEPPPPDDDQSAETNPDRVEPDIGNPRRATNEPLQNLGQSAVGDESWDEPNPVAPEERRGAAKNGQKRECGDMDALTEDEDRKRVAQHALGRLGRDR
jgi:hypothetical protein